MSSVWVARRKTTSGVRFRVMFRVGGPEHVQAVHRLLATAYKLPLLVLDGTGMRVGELHQLTRGDVDEQRGRWRVSQAVSNTRRGRWVSVPPVLLASLSCSGWCVPAARTARTSTGLEPRPPGRSRPPVTRTASLCAQAGGRSSRLRAYAAPRTLPFAS